ncbi:cyclic peptide export ABC transporter [Sphingobacterium kitahiroshimense]|uniref:Cyclic peptide export ABC transporter n=1 Tax=Sphingobacterium kitahiroshimense TaxID=470446 RepID=A0ABV0BLY6_9SPHI
MKMITEMLLPVLGKRKILKLIILGIFSGLCTFLFINTVTRVIAELVSGNLKSVSLEYILLFCSIILFFIWIRTTLYQSIINLSQTVFWDLRKQILSLILNGNYYQISSRKVDIHTAMVSDVNVLTQASMSIIDFSVAVILATTCLVYLSLISFPLFITTIVVALLGMSIYYLNSKKNLERFRYARYLEDRFLLNLNSILDGFKEIHMEPKKGKAIYIDKITPISNDAYKNNMAAFTGFLNNQITGQVLFYILIAGILLGGREQLQIKISDMVSFVFTLLFLLNAIETLMVLLPNLSRAVIASKRIMDLKAELEGILEEKVDDTDVESPHFQRIDVEKLEFWYQKNDSEFCIGPINLNISKGEIIFIYGGNGSGKTTFLYCLLGLLARKSGEIKINGKSVTADNYASYKANFAVVFNDFYLFDELYGISEFNEVEWHFYIRLFDLETKVELKSGCFSTINLSTGQRKRLALITALLEKKPVLVIDEWAADQDPHFRKKFYTEILPLLKEKGLTVIAITHDDQYYISADKLYRMNDGKLEGIENNQTFSLQNII